MSATWMLLRRRGDKWDTFFTTEQKAKDLAAASDGWDEAHAVPVALISAGSGALAEALCLAQADPWLAPADYLDARGLLVDALESGGFKVKRSALPKPKPPAPPPMKIKKTAKKT